MRIGEVARRSGVSARMLRHYDSLGLVSPSERSSAGYREYSPDDVVRIFHVECLRALGLSLKEAGSALDDPGFEPAGLLTELARRSRERITREKQLLGRLADVADAGPANWEAVLDVVSALTALDSEDASARQRAALTQSGSALSGEVLARALLAETDPNVAGALRWGVVRTGTDVSGVLTHALHDDDPDVRRRAVTALTALPDAEATAALRSAAADADRRARSAAVLELALRGDDTIIPALVAMVVDGDSDVDAADALAARSDPDEQAAIFAAFQEALAFADVPARRRIAQALGEIGGAQATAMLTELVADDDEGTSVIARYLLEFR